MAVQGSIRVLKKREILSDHHSLEAVLLPLTLKKQSSILEHGRSRNKSTMSVHRMICIHGISVVRSSARPKVKS